MFQGTCVYRQVSSISLLIQIYIFFIFFSEIGTLPISPCWETLGPFPKKKSKLLPDPSPGLSSHVIKKSVGLLAEERDTTSLAELAREIID